jgi:hypothetical protein
MTAFAELLAQAGLVSEAQATAASRSVDQRRKLDELCSRVQKALVRGDIKTYVRLRSKLPRKLQAKY